MPTATKSVLLIQLARRELQEIAPDQGDHEVFVGQELGGVGVASRRAVGGVGQRCLYREAGQFMKICVVSWVQVEIKNSLVCPSLNPW